MIITNRTKLVPFNEEHYTAIFNNDNIKLGELLNVATPTTWSEFEAAQQAIHSLYGIYTSLNGDTRWGSYFIILKEEKKLIGTCGFKGVPHNNCVEIGYEINTAYQNKGFATEIVNALIAFAFQNKINGIMAHTLAEENASVKVLRKCNFKFVRDINDPEDGLIWQWMLCKD